MCMLAACSGSPPQYSTFSSSDVNIPFMCALEITVSDMYTQAYNHLHVYARNGHGLYKNVFVYVTMKH